MALNGVLSEEILVTSGVPQGSILGPLLFLLSVNSAFDVSISRNSVLEMYADDILLYMITTCLEDVICFQSDINLLVDWIESKDLRLNMKKTKFMLISRKREQQDINLTINGSPIQQVSSFTYLGVTLSQDLSWGLHIDKVCLKAKSLLGYLYRGFRLASPTCIKLWCFPCCHTAQRSGTHTSVGGQLNWRGCKGLRLDSPPDGGLRIVQCFARS